MTDQGETEATVRRAARRLLGRRLADRYRLDALIGVGGMGAVFRGYDLVGEADVALKILRPDAVDADAAARFRREARALSQLRHPNCVHVIDVGHDRSGLPFIAMELIDGASLGEIMLSGMSPPQVVDVTRQILCALEHAHAQGVIHRDIKPDNILVTSVGDGGQVVQLIDFGLAQVFAEGKREASYRTGLGRTCGTPDYMSPEQTRAEPVDERSDIYSLGLVLFQMLAGYRAFEGENAVMLLHQQLTAPPRPLPTTVPEAIAQLVVWMLHPDPASRPSSARELRLALEAANIGVFRRPEPTAPPAPAVDRVGIDTVDAPVAQAGQVPSPVPADEQARDTSRIPETIGRFEIRGRIGHGTMGDVYAAWDPQLRRPIAVKVVRRGGERFEAEGRARLIREAQALAKLSHPNVIQIYEAGTHDDDVFLAMELVRGTTLRDWLDGQRRSWTEVLSVFAAAGQGLAAAHAGGLIHRDFKPDNVMLDQDLRVRVLDFGLARTSEMLASPTDGMWQPRPSLTGAGRMVGTPAYTAPEQLSGLGADARSDQFSFCVSLWEALYGVRPHVGATTLEIVCSVLEGTIAEPVRRGVPRWMHRVLLRGLATEPDKRWPSMDQLLVALGWGRRRRRRTRLAGALLPAVAATGVAVSLGFDSPGQCDAATDAIQDVWNDTARDEVRRAFADTGLLSADAAAAHTVEVLQRYAQAWSAQARTNCDVARDPEAGASVRARATCLARGEAAMSSLLEVLRAPDARVIESATSAATALPDVRQCVAAIQGNADESEIDAGVRLELVKARAKAEAGLFVEALPQLRALALDAQQHASPAVEADVLLALADARASLADHGGARDDLERAFDLATASHHDAGAAQAAIALGFERGYESQRFDEGMVWIRVAEATIARVADRADLEIALLRAKSAILHRQGEFEASLAIAAQRVERIRSSRGPRHPSIVAALSDLAVSTEMQGRRLDAIALLTEALDVGEAVFGANHPALGQPCQNLASMWRKEGDSEAARRTMTRALEIARGARGQMHDAVAMPLAYLAEMDFERGQFKAARVGALEAHRILATVHPAGTTDLATTHGLLARLAQQAGDYSEAVAQQERAVQIVRSIAGDDHPRLGRELAALGRVLVASRRHQAAIDRFAEAERLLQAEPVHAADAARVMLERAAALRQLSRGAEADALAQSALVAIAKLPAP